MKISSFLLACVLGGTSGALSTVAVETNEPNPVPAPSLPALQTLELDPASLVLHDGRDERRVLVWGKTSDGRKFDLTSQASLEPQNGVVSVDKDDYIRPREKGSGAISVSAAGLKASLPVTVEKSEKPPVRFVRDIEPLMGKIGCNAGTCHGSAKGKNGFKLSLRGYDPEFDYQALINDLSGRRFNRVAVEESLMLLKPTAEVPHEGRQVIVPGSRQYDLLRGWIAEGVPFEDPEQARAKSIEILPADVDFDLPGRTQHVVVLAKYGDGSVRDVTREAVFSSSNGDVAQVKEGLITALRRGEAAVLIRYEGIYGTQRVTVMGDRTGYEWAEEAENNFIDKLVDAKLRRMKIRPAPLCTDAEFMRRVSLDLTGLPPTPDRVRAFLADTTPSREKRERLVDELLASKDYTEFWANKWADLLQCNSDDLGQKGVWVYREWIRRAVAENRPYDKFVRDLLLAQGSAYRNPPVNYFRVLREPGKMTEDISQTFLGVRFNCNKCHDHPFEKWTQDQYYQFGAYFARVAIKRGTLPGEEVIYRNFAGGEVTHPKTGHTVAPKVPFGSTEQTGADESRREVFVDWLTSKDNPYFAKSMANRVWSYLLGKGIIDPVDDIRASNPPSNPELLTALTEHFVSHQFDLRELMRVICRARTYQRSILTSQWNQDDQVNFSHALPRRLSAEQILDAVAVATGVRPKFQNLPAGMRAVEIPDGKVAGNDFLTLFGRPKRQSACECERSSNISLSHALNLINGETISQAVDSPNSRIARWAAEEKDNHKLIEDIYLAVLNRPPTEKEQATVDLSKGPRLELAQDLAWALLNSPAFLFNR